MSTVNNGYRHVTVRWVLALGVLGAGGALGCSSDDNGGGNNGTPDSGGSDASTGQDGATVPDSSSGSDATAKPDGSSDGGSDAAADARGNDAEAGAVEGNVVIADQFNNRVIEVDSTGKIVWSFGDGKAAPGPTSVVAPNDAERLPNGQTLISGTGAPTGTTDFACEAREAGPCPDNRVVLVNSDGGIAWMYTDLSAPVCARMLANGHVLITDQGNSRVIEVAGDAGPDAAPVWQYAPTAADGGDMLAGPNSAERTAAGTTLIADEGNGRVLEVAADGGIVWQYTVVADGGAPQVAYASRLPNGNTLVTDSTDNVILEVAPDGGVAWSYTVTGDAGATGPTRAVRLANGHTLISNQTDNTVIEIDNSTPPKIIATYGRAGVIGTDGGLLNAPYDAKRVGDYTGISEPPR